MVICNCKTFGKPSSAITWKEDKVPTGSVALHVRVQRGLENARVLMRVCNCLVATFSKLLLTKVLNSGKDYLIGEKEVKGNGESTEMWGFPVLKNAAGP